MTTFPDVDVDVKEGENLKTPSDDWRRDVGDLDDVCSPIRHVRALYLFTFYLLLYLCSSSSSSASSHTFKHHKTRHTVVLPFQNGNDKTPWLCLSLSSSSSCST